MLSRSRHCFVPRRPEAGGGVEEEVDLAVTAHMSTIGRMADESRSATDHPLEGVALENTHEGFETLVKMMQEQPDWKDDIAKAIEETFTQERAIMVLDLSGFSRTTQKKGIISFMLMINQMRRLATPMVARRGGTVVKAEADNLFCLFPSASDAVAAAQEIAGQLDTANVVLPSDSALYASFGIGYGQVLNIADEDLWGDELNQTSKLGEDIAEKGQILLTESAWGQVKDEGLEASEQHVTISGLDLIYYSVGH
jgi:adenylate cyclase